MSDSQMSKRDRIVELPFGSQQLRVTIREENLLTVARPADASPIADPAAAVLQAIREPVGTAPLPEMVKAGQKVLVIIDDNTRATPQHQILPALLQELEDAAQGLEIKVLVATGTHRAMTADEIRQKVGAEVAGRYAIINHSWSDKSNLVALGTTSNGTPIEVNRLVMEAGLVLGIGATVPHCLAGWGGGAKIIQPGVCGEVTTNRTHALNMISPMPHLGRLDNPMRREIDEVVNVVPLHFMVNVVLARHAEIVFIAAGDPLISHRKSVEFARGIWEVPVPGLADIVLVSSYPADIDYWQGIKGLFAAELVVKRGGDIILATPCTEGISGTPEHAQTMAALAGLPSKCMRREAEKRGIKDLAGVNTAVVASRVNELAWVSVYSQGLTDEHLRILGHERVPSLQEGLRRAFARQGNHAKVIVITHGGDTYPTLAARL